MIVKAPLFRLVAPMLALLLFAASTASANLLVNGDFETPGSLNAIPGWVFWRASSWGSGEIAQTTTLTKVTGSRALALTCLSSSFGVYQEVTVTPGKAYQMNGWWKGSFPLDQTSWYDCELLDGPFDYTTADNRPYDLKYKICTYDPATAVWDWQKMSDAYPTVLPLVTEAGGSITKNGIRVASGTKLTVVLKTGGFSHPYGYYDGITLNEVPQMSAADAGKQPNGTPVMITERVTAVFANGFYVESSDRSCGIKVTATDISAPPASEGQMAKVAGVVLTSPAGERYIDASYVSFSAN